MSRFVLSGLLPAGLPVGTASTIAKAFEEPADQKKHLIRPDKYWTWLQQNAGG